MAAIIGVSSSNTGRISMTERAEDPILELITWPIPERLWHYTDLDGFRGIVKSKRIHATNIKYLNDREEFKHALALAKRLLLEKLPPEADAPLVRQLVIGEFDGIFERGALSPKNLSLFTASFTVNGDLLSQWRGYSAGSAGVSLGFDFRGVREITAPSSPVIFAPCVYENDEKERLLRLSIAPFAGPVLDIAAHAADIPTWERAHEEIRREKPDLGEEEVDFERQQGRWKQELPRSVGEATAKLFHLIGLLKSSAFQEEQEWRYVFPVFADMPKPPELRFRSRSNVLVPYIEFPLVGGLEGNASFRLREVIIGPGSEDQLAVDSARALLNSADAKGVAVSHSRIPYRTW
jgi:hypothetical protein